MLIVILHKTLVLVFLSLCLKSNFYALFQGKGFSETCEFLLSRIIKIPADVGTSGASLQALTRTPVPAGAAGQGRTG